MFSSPRRLRCRPLTSLRKFSIAPSSCSADWYTAPFLGQGEAGAATLAQAQAEALLQIAHVQADGRAADAQHALGGGEAAALDHAAEDAQQADFKVADLGQRVGSAGAHGEPLSLMNTKLKIGKVGIFQDFRPLAT